MMIDIKYGLGTQKEPQQTELSAPAFTDTDHVHFPDGRLTTIPPYSTTSFTDDYVTITGGLRSIFAAKLTGTYVGTYYFFATHTKLYVVLNNTLYNITPLKTTKTADLGTDSLDAVDTDATLTVNYTSHGLAVGDRIKLTGATDFAGITAATYINIEHIITTVPDADSFTVELGTTASSTASGGGSAIDIFTEISSGILDQGAASGFGAGLYGEGLYGQGGPAVSAQSFPRIWSFDTFGNEVVMCPGDYTSGDGQKIYIWDGDTATAPTVLTNAPTDCNWVTVVNNSIVALCGNTIKISELGDGTVWSGYTYYEKSLERVWKAVSCYKHGEKEAVIFTPQEAILLRYVGGGDLWDLSDLFTEDGILAPMCAVVSNTVLYWQGARGMYSYDGGPPQKIENNQNEKWIIENINYGQAWKSFAMRGQENDEVWFYFPTGTDNEPADYAIVNPSGHVTLGEMSRACAQRPGMVDNVFYMGEVEGASSEASIYKHFTAGAVTFTWYAETAYAYYGDGEFRVIIDEMWPDLNQDGTVTITFYTKEHPKGSETTFGPYNLTTSTEYITPFIYGRLVKWRLDGSTAMTFGASKMNVKREARR